MSCLGTCVSTINIHFPQNKNTSNVPISYLGEGISHTGAGPPKQLRDAALVSEKQAPIWGITLGDLLFVQKSGRTKK